MSSMGETITLGGAEQRRLMVLNRVLRGELSRRQGAELLELCERQFRRILTAYREEGAAGLVHGNRGRRPANALGEELRARVVELARTRYAGYNHQHLTEELNEVEGMGIDRSTVRRILLDAGVPSPRKRRAPRHRSRRERYAQEGMLLQIDGSRHDWLEGRGPLLTLIGGIDDATGIVPAALFREEEDAAGYLLLIHGVMLSKGIPLAVYRDGHGIFEIAPGKMSLAEELSGRREPTQFGRLLEELGVASIPARSPQAKGRIERLWGTFQDRLVSELRRAGAASLPEANLVLSSFLPRFNTRFAVPAASEGSAYRSLPEHVDPDRLFCFKYRRVVGADNTIRFGRDRIQLLPSHGRVSYVRAEVEVCEHLDGAISVYYQDKLLVTREAPAEAPLLRARKGPRRTATAAAESEARNPVERAGQDGKPSAGHPWRRKSLKMRMAEPLAEAEYGTVG
jgi:transposase